MTSQAFALLFATLAALPAAMHIALAAGAPLGRFTVGGRFPGRLPPLWRGLAVVQAGLLVGMALVVLECSGVLSTGLAPGLFWPVVGLTLVTFLVNSVSPSRPERLLWTPIILGMVVSALGTAFL
jgi:hypothetical protein